MSKYTEFIRAHIKSAPGANIKEKMKACAAQWQKQKGRGKGLHAPGTSAGRGTDWTDFNDSPALNGEGVKKRVYRKRAGIIATESGRPVDWGNKKVMFEKMLEKSKAARGGKLHAMRHPRHGKGDDVRDDPAFWTDKGGIYGPKHKKYLRDKANAARRAEKIRTGATDQFGMPKVKYPTGGALSGMVSKKQAATLAKHIAMGGKLTPAKLSKIMSCC